MATTTNYGWTTPDDTALVKDGASAIRTLGSSVDTTTKNLNPETTLGDLSFRSSTSNVNTRIPIGSSGQHLTVVAGVPAWSTASDQTPLTTKGDLFTFSTLDARLGVGANGTTLVADSSEATGLKWQAPSSGAMTKITSASFSNVSSVEIDNCFTSTYKNYFLLWDATADSVQGIDLQLQFRYAGPTTQTGGYNGAAFYQSMVNVKTDYGFTNTTAALIWGDLRTGTQQSLGNAYFSSVGQSSQQATYYGSGFGPSGENIIFYSATAGTARTYTGFLLKTDTSTMSGNYAVYGLAN
jgi:hypothetical protein